MYLFYTNINAIVNINMNLSYANIDTTVNIIMNIINVYTMKLITVNLYTNMKLIEYQ